MVMHPRRISFTAPVAENDRFVGTARLNGFDPAKHCFVCWGSGRVTRAVDGMKVTCGVCAGTGKKKAKKNGDFDGSGARRVAWYQRMTEQKKSDDACGKCDGTGYYGPYGDTCFRCEGSGVDAQESCDECDKSVRGSRLIWTGDQNLCSSCHTATRRNPNAKLNPKENDIYDPRLEHVRAITQGMYESKVCQQTGEASFRDASGMRADVTYGVHPNVFGMRTSVASRWGLLSGQKATDEGARLSMLRYAGRGTPTKADADPEPTGFKHLVDNRQDYEETLAIPRKSGFYRVTPEHTNEGLRYFVWPMKPGERLPSMPHKTAAAAQKVADHLNKTADPRVTGKWWKPSKGELSAASLSYWLPPASAFGLAAPAQRAQKVAAPVKKTAQQVRKVVAQTAPSPKVSAGLSYRAGEVDGRPAFVIYLNGKKTHRYFFNEDKAKSACR